MIRPRRHRRSQRLRTAVAWLVVFALLLQVGLAVACASHDLLHGPVAVDRHAPGDPHADHGDDADRSVFSDVAHSVCHAGHGLLHAPAMLHSVACGTVVRNGASPPALIVAASPSPLAASLLRPPIQL